MAILKDKKVVIIGDRDGVPGPAIAECVKTAGGDVVFLQQNVSSELAQAQWIWKTQKRVKEFAEEYGAEKLSSSSWCSRRRGCRSCS